MKSKKSILYINDNINIKGNVNVNINENENKKEKEKKNANEVKYSKRVLEVAQQLLPHYDATRASEEDF